MRHSLDLSRVYTDTPAAFANACVRSVRRSTTRRVKCRHGLRFLYLLSTLLLVACAGTAISPQKPEVSVVGVKPVSLSSNEQRFLFTLNIENPNAFALPVEGVDLAATFAGENVAVGRSTTEVSVPANGNAQLGIEITTQLKDMFSNFLKSLGNGNLNLDYEIAGDVKIKNLAKSFPFTSSGNLLEQTN